MSRGTGGACALRLLPLALALGACGGATSAQLTCVASPEYRLPQEVIESSGVAWSGRDENLLWTINDGRGGTLFAVDTAGRSVARVETSGPALWDTEDLAGAPCDDGYCLYIADVGDNDEHRDSVAIYRVAEPDPGVGTVARTTFPLRFPNGATDVESIIVLPGERLYLVSKGRNEAPGLYRYPGPLIADSIMLLERLDSIGAGPAGFSSRITGASWIPGTDDLVLIRSYEALYLYRIGETGLEPAPGGPLNLRSLREAQGEAVTADASGRVVLTSEAGPLSPSPGMRLLRCEFDAGFRPSG